MAYPAYEESLVRREVWDLKETWEDLDLMDSLVRREVPASLAAGVATVLPVSMDRQVWEETLEMAPDQWDSTLLGTPFEFNNMLLEVSEWCFNTCPTTIARAILKVTQLKAFLFLAQWTEIITKLL